MNSIRTRMATIHSNFFLKGMTVKSIIKVDTIKLHSRIVWPFRDSVSFVVTFLFLGDGWTRTKTVKARMRLPITEERLKRKLRRRARRALKDYRKRAAGVEAMYSIFGNPDKARDKLEMRIEL